MNPPPPPKGFTLLELTIVLAILTLLASLAIPRLATCHRLAQISAAHHDLSTLRNAFFAYLADMTPIPRFTWISPYAPQSLDSSEDFNLRVHNLLSPTNISFTNANTLAALNRWNADRFSPPPCDIPWNPDAARGWHGPYLRPSPAIRPYPSPTSRRSPADPTYAERHFFFAGTNTLPHNNTFLTNRITRSYGSPGEFAFFDPWNNPYILQVPLFSPPPPEAPTPQAPSRDFALRTRWHFARLVSAGPNGILETPLDPCAGLLPDGTAPARGDDLLLFLNRPDSFQTPPWTLP